MSTVVRTIHWTIWQTTCSGTSSTWLTFTKMRPVRPLTNTKIPIRSAALSLACFGPIRPLPRLPPALVLLRPTMPHAALKNLSVRHPKISASPSAEFFTSAITKRKCLGTKVQDIFSLFSCFFSSSYQFF